MKKFTIPCDFGNQKSPFDVYIGHPKEGNHPLQNQASWLSSERGGTIPANVMESFANLLKLASENGVEFEDLCVYALEAAQKEKSNEVAATEAEPSLSAPTQSQEPNSDVPSVEKDS